jgi:hypothetical protein
MKVRFTSLTIALFTLGAISLLSAKAEATCTKNGCKNLQNVRPASSRVAPNTSVSGQQTTIITPFAQNTQYSEYYRNSRGSNGQACGFNIYVNANTEFGNGSQQGMEASGSSNTVGGGVMFNTNPCVNDKEIEEVRSRAMERSICIQGRTNAVLNGKNPDAVCPMPKIK